MHREIHHIAGTIFNFGVFSLNQTTFNFKKKNPLLFDSTLTTGKIGGTTTHYYTVLKYHHSTNVKNYYYYCSL